MRGRERKEDQEDDDEEEDGTQKEVGKGRKGD